MLSGCLWEEPGSVFFIPSHQVFIHLGKIPLNKSVALHWTHSSMFKPVSLWGAQDQTQQSWCVSPVLSGGDHPPWPVSNALPDAVGLFCCKDALLAHVQLVLHWDPKVFLCRAAFKLVSPQHVLLPGVNPPQVLHGALTVVSTRAGTDHIFLIELDRGFDENISNIYRMLMKTKCLSIQPSYRSNGIFCKNHGIFVDFGTHSNFWKTRYKGRRIILLPLCSLFANFPGVCHTLSPSTCWMGTDVDLLHSCF